MSEVACIGSRNQACMAPLKVVRTNLLTGNVDESGLDRQRVGWYVAPALLILPTGDEQTVMPSVSLRIFSYQL